jgi:hypothetical protein
MSRCPSCAYYSCFAVPFSMHDNQQMIHLGMPECQKSMLSRRMVRIGKCYRERIAKDSRRFMKRDSMLFPIQFRLIRVPLELHAFRPLWFIILQIGIILIILHKDT